MLNISYLCNEYGQKDLLMKFLKQISAFVVFIMAMFFNVDVIDAQSMKTYYNDRYGYLMSYPAFMLAGEEPAAKDGIIIQGKKTGDAYITVFGGYNDMNIFMKSLRDSFNDCLTEYAKRGTQLKTRKLYKNGFVVSGVDKGYQFYRRVIWQDDYFADVVFRYRVGVKSMYSPYVKKVLTSLHFPKIDE